MVAVLISARVWAAELEHRTFAVRLDGNPAGEFRMTVQKLDDGSQLMAAQALLAAKRGGSTWRYSYRALETWKGGRLQKFESHSEEDGKKRHLIAALQDRGLRVNFNDRRHDVAPEAWTNTFWFVPTMAQRAQSVVLFDVETGKESTGMLEYLGTERRTVGSTEMECGHYRVRTGDYSAELWFDASDRLVRRESAWYGYKMVLEMLKVQK